MQSIKNLSENLKNEKIDIFNYYEKTINFYNKVDININSFLPEINKKDRIFDDIAALLKKYPTKENRPDLFGIPVGIKDLMNVDGFETKCGSNLPAELFKTPEASFITKLKNAGAIVFGKTVTTEFAYFEPGKTANPHNLNHTPGGSSSGSAAAVSAEIIPLSFGTQTIGSIIRPAAFCGVTGFKPSYNRIAKDGVIPFSPTADHIGYFAQTIDDIDYVSSILCDNWKTAKNQKDNLKICIVSGDYLEQVNIEILNSFGQVIEKLKLSDVEIIKADIFGDIEKINSIHKKMIAYEFAKVHEEWIKSYKNLYRPKTLELIEEGKKVSEQEYLFAKNNIEILRNQVEKIKTENEIDVWLSPATITPAPEGLTATGSPLMNLPWTYIGVPVLTIPIGFSGKKLPIGLQISGSFNEDELLLLNSSLLHSFLDKNTNTFLE